MVDKISEQKEQLGNQGYKEDNEGYDNESQHRGPIQQARKHGSGGGQQSGSKGKPPDGKKPVR